MRPIRVLVVDDSVVVRKLISDILASDPDIEVVGTAANGRIALQKTAHLNPDIVTLDFEMPVMNGLETIVELRANWPFMPIIMVSALTEVGAVATLEALSRGATDYITKPANVGSTLLAQEQVRADLLPKIKTLCSRVVATELERAPMQPRVHRAPLAHASAARPPVSVVAVGVSTGGPNALAALTPELPADLAVPIVITQHMPPVFTRFLADRLTAVSNLTFTEAASGTTLRPAAGYVAPGGHHMGFERHGREVSVCLNQQAAENSCRPSVDVMLRSAVDVYGPGVLAVILTGMGQDGLRGAELVKAAGGQVLVQDEASSVVWGMPGIVAHAGLADAVLPLRALAAEIVRRVRGRAETPASAPSVPGLGIADSTSLSHGRLAGARAR